MSEQFDYLKSDLAAIPFAFKGQLGEASKAIEPILQAFENADIAALPYRISSGYQKQIKTEIDQLQKAGLKRVIRITSPQFCSAQNRNSLGFTRWIDASREWRECEITAAVLDQYIDIQTGECVIEKFDECATLSLRQSRHIKASDQKKAKNSKADVYTREHHVCPSCGAELTHIADKTNCPYCGAYITFNFFDWQLDSFYLDLHKASLLDGVKAAAVKTTVGIAGAAAKTTELLAGAWDRRDAATRSKAGFDNTLGAALTVLIVIGFLLLAVLLAMPWYLRAALGIIVLILIIGGIIKYLKKTEQSRKKKRIVRYSDAYLRSCVYDEIWKTLSIENLIDFSIDDLRLTSVENTETTTTIEVSAAVIKKYISQERSIHIVTEDVLMKLRRARYPEKKKNKGKLMEEKACPSCGANFQPDEHHCCSYCGYGLKMENYIWRRVDA